MALSSWIFVTLGVFLAGTVAYLSLTPAVAGGARPEPAKVGAALATLAPPGSDLQTLSVSYSDMHGLHGGLSLKISGDGRISQQAVRTPVGEPKAAVAPADLRRLIALLIELAAWEQRVPDARPVPDESRAHVRIEIAGHYSVIWERYNDLRRGQRIVRIRDLMSEIAWQPRP
jgi:hypothetical protein